MQSKDYIETEQVFSNHFLPGLLSLPESDRKKLLKEVLKVIAILLHDLL